MNITLNDKLREYVSNQVESGKFNTESEVISNALRIQAELSIDRKIENGRGQVLNGEMEEATAGFFNSARLHIDNNYN